MDIKALLDQEVVARNKETELSLERLDPVMVAHRYRDPAISLICALFAYGNVKQIVKFLNSLDFSLLQKSEAEIEKQLSQHYYRFQNAHDIIALFIALKRLEEKTTLEAVFLQKYDIHQDVIAGVHGMIAALKKQYDYSSRGYEFLLSKVSTKTRGSGALKRWMMFVRWMIRKDCIDMGLWSGVSWSDLIIPLDTHTLHVSQRVGLLQRKTYDLQAAIELTEKLKEFDRHDPLKYDFALYRLGQEKLL